MNAVIGENSMSFESTHYLILQIPSHGEGLDECSVLKHRNKLLRLGAKRARPVHGVFVFRPHSEIGFLLPPLGNRIISSIEGHDQTTAY